MAQSASYIKSKENPETTGWELFEVGSYEEVIHLASENSNSPFLSQLALLAKIEIDTKIGDISPKGITHLSPIVEAYLNVQKKKFKDASNHLDLYFKNSNALVCFQFVKLSVSTYFKVEKYKEALHSISLYKKKLKDKAFLSEEIQALYELKEYQEIISEFQKNSSDLNSPQLLKILGMSLLFLGKHKEAEKILGNIPGRLNLPSFEEKRKEYELIIKEIHKYEMKSSSLSNKELEDLGFAYLFNGNYAEAEKTFLRLTNLLK
ncbi:MAG: hypothetical protein CK427_02540 [Leptospira sp.]|nr:MAG: hypothetical protein CK427_02540 [Leptospira sp.]